MLQYNIGIAPAQQQQQQQRLQQFYPVAISSAPTPSRPDLLFSDPLWTAPLQVAGSNAMQQQSGVGASSTTAAADAPRPYTAAPASHSAYQHHPTAQSMQAPVVPSVSLPACPPPVPSALPSLPAHCRSSPAPPPASSPRKRSLSAPLDVLPHERSAGVLPLDSLVEDLDAWWALMAPGEAPLSHRRSSRVDGL